MPFRRPPKVEIINLHDLESFACQINPETLTRVNSAEYQKHNVIGLSHKPLQYTGSDNRTLPGVEFHVDRNIDRAYDVPGFLRFMASMTLTPRAIGGAPQNRPARTLFVWPGVVTMECVIRKVVEKMKLFYTDGTLRAATVTVDFEEVRDVRWFADDIRHEVVLEDFSLV